MAAKRLNATASVVKEKLRDLAKRVPGRLSVPAAGKPTLIAGQLIKVDEEEITLRADRDTYGIPVAAIEDIRDIRNPSELERATGVDVVITLKAGAGLETRAADLARKSELPFALANREPARPQGEHDQMLRTRTQRWLKLNGLVLEIAGSGPGQFDTMMCSCSAMTQQGAGNMACDCYDKYPEMGGRGGRSRDL